MTHDKARDLPEQARRLLEGTTPGPWEVDESDHHVWAIGPIDGSANGSELCCQITDARLAAAAPILAAMVAGMREEWSRQARITGDPRWYPIRWCRSRDEAERTYWTRSLPTGARVEYRLVPRYIIEPETTDG